MHASCHGDREVLTESILVNCSANVLTLSWENSTTSTSSGCWGDLLLEDVMLSYESTLSIHTPSSATITVIVCYSPLKHRVNYNKRIPSSTYAHLQSRTLRICAALCCRGLSWADSSSEIEVEPVGKDSWEVHWSQVSKGPTILTILTEWTCNVGTQATLLHHRSIEAHSRSIIHSVHINSANIEFHRSLDVYYLRGDWHYQPSITANSKCYLYHHDYLH